MLRAVVMGLVATVALVSAPAFAADHHQVAAGHKAEAKKPEHKAEAHKSDAAAKPQAADHKAAPKGGHK